jgi:hypothetical protein
VGLEEDARRAAAEADAAAATARKARWETFERLTLEAMRQRIGVWAQNLGIAIDEPVVSVSPGGKDTVQGYDSSWDVERPTTASATFQAEGIQFIASCHPADFVQYVGLNSFSVHVQGSSLAISNMVDLGRALANGSTSNVSAKKPSGVRPPLPKQSEGRGTAILIGHRCQHCGKRGSSLVFRQAGYDHDKIECRICAKHGPRYFHVNRWPCKHHGQCLKCAQESR